MKKFFSILLATALLIGLCTTAWAARPMSRKQYRRNLANNKNAMPAGWQYEAGYAVWRANRKKPVNRASYKLYKKDRAWHYNMRRNHGTQRFFLNTLDWSVEELALLMRENEEYLKFHPAGFEK